jgi:hypothetical protein
MSAVNSLLQSDWTVATVLLGIMIVNEDSALHPISRGCYTNPCCYAPDEEGARSPAPPVPVREAAVYGKTPSLKCTEDREKDRRSRNSGSLKRCR